MNICCSTCRNLKFYFISSRIRKSKSSCCCNCCCLYCCNSCYIRSCYNNTICCSTKKFTCIIICHLFSLGYKGGEYFYSPPIFIIRLLDFQTNFSNQKHQKNIFHVL